MQAKQLACEDISKYEMIFKVGQGTFGEVFKARNVKDKSIVAVKKVITDNDAEGFPITTIREVKILKSLVHVNIVNFIEVCSKIDVSGGRKLPKFRFYLVFEFCEHDLAGLLCNKTVTFSLGEKKMIMKQLLNGLYFVHQNNIIHRDIKAANILITRTGTLKLADFGLSRPISGPKERAQRYTNKVVTLWYRPPELLLGARHYGTSVDMWGAGCIMAELWTRKPIMKGVSEQHQLELISKLCGSITNTSYPGVEELELFNKIELAKDHKRKLKETLKSAVTDSNALNLLDDLLKIDPNGRIDSDTALMHDFFCWDPLPEDLKLENYSQSNFEFYANRNPLQAQNGIQKPVLRQANVMEEYYDRVF